MNRFFKTGLRAALCATTALGASVVMVAPAQAQLTTATVGGQVTGADGAPIADAQITATSPSTGQTRRATTNAQGSYTLAGLSPGTYDFVAEAAAGKSRTQRASVQVAQTATLDITIGTPASEVVDANTIVVTAALPETRTSEIGTNVTRQQIEDLPQNNRNFLNFANLAPGISVNNSEFRRNFSGGGISADPNGESLGGPQINVFIDGVSLKSNIQSAGIVGQDSSRGNPFSQLAIQEFRVITSNYKAEYEDAGTAIITAITKSGTNEFHGDAFVSFQNKALVERDFFQKQRGDPRPALKRYQFGAALGGPIIKDKLFFFFNYEGNIQDRAATVIPGGSPANQAAFQQQSGLRLSDYVGTYTSPFRENLGFGKLTWQIADNQRLELTGSIRKETDLRDFGTPGTPQNARSRGTDIINDTYTGKIDYQLTTDSFVNQFTIDYLRANLRFGVAPGSDFGRTYQGIISIGGRPDSQVVHQTGLTFRDDLTYIGFDRHTIKGGIKLSFQKYQIGGSGPNANPQFNFVADPANNLDFSLPQEVNFGAGNPNINAKTTQLGLFVQDDWAITDNLLLNIGLRWDYDSNAKNNSFVTPPGAVAALRALGADPRIGSFYNVNDYISTGSNRKADLSQFQPRVGFSYDVNADQRTVFFGGYGRYYDRVLFRNAAEESLLTQYRSGNIQFSRDGLPRNGRQTILFQPQYLTPTGFAALLASLQSDPTSPGTSELRVIPNNLKSPHTDQFSVGVRQRIGGLRTSLSYNYTIGSDQVGYAPLNRTVATNAGGFYDFIPLINGYSNAVAAFNTRATRYHGVYLTVDKPYTKASGYGFGLAYTLAFSKERGFAFNFDFPNIGARPFVPNAGDVRHKLVLNGIADLPWGFQISSLATISSPVPFFVIDASKGFGARDIVFPGNVGKLPAFIQVDVRLKKDFTIFNDHTVSLTAEVFNLFNRANFGGADGFIPPGGNTNFGNPNGLAGPSRSIQFGAAYRF